MQDHHSWAEIDKVYTYCRRQLAAMTDWRYGPNRVEEVAQEGFQGVLPYINPEGKTYCDLGCGTFHPYGVATIFFLNGASACIALDLEGTDSERAAEALADLLADCLCFPEKWHWSGISRAAFLARVQSFDIHDLKKGLLVSGLRNCPINHLVTDIHSPALERESIDIMSSRATLEHFLDFETAVARLHAIMRPGGVGFHSIDLVDHRAYLNEAFHYWSFLAEGPDWTDGVCNRLRTSQLRSCFERAGFEILFYENVHSEMPEGFTGRLAPPFSSMSIEELSTISVRCIIRKPS